MQKDQHKVPRPRSDPRKGRRLCAIGEFLCPLGLAAGGIFAVGRALGSEFGSFILSILMILVGLVGLCCIHRGKKLIGQDARPLLDSLGIATLREVAAWREEHRVSETTNLVAYLRPFEADDYSIFQLRGRQHLLTEEEELRDAVALFGPMVAIGRPGESLQTPGAARLYVADDEWQEVVRNLTEQARLVVLRVGQSEGLLWELEHLLQNAPPHKVVLFLAFRGFRWRRQRSYRAFCDRVQHLFPHDFPRRLGKALFMCFDSDWTPRLLGTSGPSAAMKAVMLADGHLRTEYLCQLLSPVFESLGETIRCRRPTPNERLYYWFVQVFLWACMLLPLLVGTVMLLIVLR